MSIISACVCHMAKATLTGCKAWHGHTTTECHGTVSPISELGDVGNETEHTIFPEKHFEGARPKSFYGSGDHYSWQPGTLALREWRVFGEFRCVVHCANSDIWTEPLNPRLQPLPSEWALCSSPHCERGAGAAQEQMYGIVFHTKRNGFDQT